MSSAVARAGPITSTERVLYIDILRGMALFGILAANMRGFNAPMEVYGNIKVLFHGRADLIAQAFIDIFIQGKFVSLFSFLFGLGFAVQMMRADARGARFMSFYPRRLMALALFGLIHGILIWAGDILLSYAITGAMLLLFRHRQQKTVLIWAGSILAAPMVIISGFYIAYILGVRRGGLGEEHKTDMAKVQNIINVYAHGTVPQTLRENWIVWKDSLYTLAFSIVVLCLFLAGLWVWRSGIVERLAEDRPPLQRGCSGCLPLGLLLNAAVVLRPFLIPPAHKPTFIGWLANVVSIPSLPLLSLGYASGLALLIQNERWRARLKPFAAVGRMALTNYLTQSVVCTLFYYNYTTGLYGRVGPAMGLIPTVVLYGSQVFVSNWWLSRYRFGPMEWLWRGMTYGVFPSMRVEPAPPAALPEAAGGVLEP